MQRELKRDFFSFDEVLAIVEGQKVSKGDGSSDDPVSRQINVGVESVLTALKGLAWPTDGLGALCFLQNQDVIAIASSQLNGIEGDLHDFGVESVTDMFSSFSVPLDDYGALAFEPETGEVFHVGPLLPA